MRSCKPSSIPAVRHLPLLAFARYNPTGQPTGRPEFPGFIARSRRDPDSELRDPEAWAKLWSGARDRLAVHPPTKPAHRWRGTEPVCA